MYDDRPNRPPNPDGSLPPHAEPAGGDGTCYPSGATMANFLDQVRAVMRAEWIRLRGGAPLDPNLEMSLLNELMTAFSVGKVIPGYRAAADGTCTMHWNELACFARWYALLKSDPTVPGPSALAPTRQDVLDSLTYGEREPWTSSDETPWPPAPTPCGPNAATTEADWCADYWTNGACPNLWCCPPEVYNDPTYVGDSSKKDSNTKWIAIGAGALVAAGALAAIIAASSPSDRYVVAS